MRNQGNVAIKERARDVSFGLAISLCLIASSALASQPPLIHHVELPTESWTEAPTNAVIPVRVHTNWFDETPAVFVEVRRVDNQSQVLGMLIEDMERQHVRWQPVLPSGERAELEPYTEYSVSIRAGEYWEVIGASSVELTLTTGAGPATPLESEPSVTLESAQQCHFSCCAVLSRPVVTLPSEQNSQYLGLSVDVMKDGQWKAIGSRWGANQTLPEPIDYQWLELPEEFCVRVVVESLLDGSSTTTTSCSTIDEMVPEGPETTWCYAWSLVAPQDLDAIPTHGLLVFGAKLAHPSSWDPTPEHLAQVSVTVRDHQGQSLAGTLEYNGELQVVIWRGAEPFLPQSSYQVTAEFLQPPEWRHIREDQQLAFSIQISAGPVEPIAAPKIRFITPHRNCDLDFQICCRPGMIATYEHGMAGPTMGYRWLEARPYSDGVVPDRVVHWSGSAGTTAIQARWSGAQPEYCIEVIAHSLLDGSSESTWVCESHAQLFIDPTIEWCDQEFDIDNPPDLRGTGSGEDDISERWDTQSASGSVSCTVAPARRALSAGAAGMLLLLLTLCGLRGLRREGGGR